MTVCALSLSGCAVLNCNCSESESYGCVDVGFDWNASPSANPEGMSVLFYPTDGNPYWRFELKNEGGQADPPAGAYNIISFNSDTSINVFENQESYQSVLVTSQESLLSDALSLDWSANQPPRSAGDDNQPVMKSPDPMWVAYKEQFSVTDELNSVILSPVAIVAKYRVKVMNVDNSESSYLAGFSISGLSAGRYLSSLRLIEHEVTVPGNLMKSESDIFEGSIYSFGKITDMGSSHLYLYFNLRDGSKKAFSYDVTSIIENAPDPMNVEIIIDGISLPPVDTATPDSGLDVDIDDWDIIDIDLST